jgi:hypothetical protein
MHPNTPEMKLFRQEYVDHGGRVFSAKSRWTKGKHRIALLTQVSNLLFD